METKQKWRPRSRPIHSAETEPEFPQGIGIQVGFSGGLHKESNAFFHDFRRWAFVARRKRRPLVENRGYTGGDTGWGDASLDRPWSIQRSMVSPPKHPQFRGVRARSGFVTPRKPDHWSITLADGAPATRSARLGRPWSAQPTAPNRHHGQRAFPFQRFPSLSFEVSFPLPFLPFPSFPFLPHRAIASGPRRHVRMAIA